MATQLQEQNTLLCDTPNAIKDTVSAKPAQYDD